MRRGTLTGLLLVTLVAAGCGAHSDGETAAPQPSPESPSTTAPSEAPTSPSAPPSASPDELRRELVRMGRQDQGKPTRGVPTTHQQRIARLEEIIETHGWPTYDLVGKGGADAAWLIAQHADLDPEFQRLALGLLRAAVADGQASPGNLAYLDDRVAAAEGRPQRYGTQIDCTDDGAVPRGGLLFPGRVDRLRAAAGLDPLEDYLATMSDVCQS